MLRCAKQGFAKRVLPAKGFETVNTVQLRLMDSIVESADLVKSESNVHTARINSARYARWLERGLERHSFGRKASVTLSIFYILTLHVR